MNVSLTPELENFVTAKVQGGRYRSASEVVREALRLLEKRDLEDDVLKGLRSGPPSDVTPEFWENMRAAFLARDGRDS